MESGLEKKMKGNVSKNGIEKFESGMVREMVRGKGRFDLLSPFALLRMAQTAEAGTVKYDDRNWEKGCPFSEFLNRVLIHLNDYMLGKKDEDHLAHAMWGIQALIHMEETKPHLNDLPHYKKAPFFRPDNVLYPKPKSAECIPPGTELGK